MTFSYKSPRMLAGRGSNSLESGRAGATREHAAPALFRLLSESALYRAVFSACGVPLGIVDARAPRPQLVQVNRAFERCFGYHGSEACRYSVAALLLNGDVGLERRLFTEHAARTDVAIKRRDGATLHMVVTIDPLLDLDGKLTHWAVSFAQAAEKNVGSPLLEALAQP